MMLFKRNIHTVQPEECGVTVRCISCVFSYVLHGFVGLTTYQIMRV